MLEKRFANGVLVLTFNHFNRLSWLRHGFTTRIGGVSAPPFNSFNLGKNTSDEKEALKENYNRLINGNEAETFKIFLTNQVHGDTIQCVAFDKEISRDETIFDKTDGLMTKESEAFLMSFYADCTPLFLLIRSIALWRLVTRDGKGQSKILGRRQLNKCVLSIVQIQRIY